MIEDQLNDIIPAEGCPKCGSANVSPVKYTWWGGVLGPKLFHHTKCHDCKFLYNRKTGKSNTQAIVLYSVIAFIIVFALSYFIRSR